ncbi:MAG: hypothetical protein PUK16_05270 [Prevotellaceae bacterium]|nr:hypothetical protein [Prevotellaceae bacterium]
MKKLFFIALLLAPLCGCRHHSPNTNRLLENVDSLVQHNHLDSASALLEKIRMDDLANASDSAHFFLRKTQVLYRLYKPIPSTEMIDYSIGYYERHGMAEKLADACFYKGVTLYEQGKAREAVVCIKKAEYVAKKLDDIDIRHKIYENLFIMNEEAGETALALDYAKKVLTLSSAADNKMWLARAFNNIAVAYNKLNKPDSAGVYVRKSMEMLAYIPVKERIYILNNLGAQLIPTNPQLAKTILLKVLQIEPMGAAYENLATIYMEEGDTGKAGEMWNKALKTDNRQVRVEVMKSRFAHQCATGNYKDAAATAQQLMALKDSLYKSRMENNIKSSQIIFDNMKSKQMYERNIEISILLILLLAFSFAIVFLFFRYRTYKVKGALAMDRMRIRNFEKQITELEHQGQNKEKEIEALIRKKEKLLDKHRGILYDGHKLYIGIMEGQTTVLWKKKEFENFLEYYRLVDMEFMDMLELEYDELSSKYKFFMVMEHWGKSDKDIMRIMGLAESSIRSARSRINKRRSSALA